MSSRPVLTEQEFWRDYELIATDIEVAIECFYTYPAIKNIIFKSPENFAIYEKNHRYWNIHLYCLQSTFFITLRRIFDNKHHSIHRLLTATAGQPELFSKEIFTQRKKAQLKGDTSLLEECVERAYFPTKEELLLLKKNLKSHASKVESKYRPIRDIYAHILYKEPEKIEELFKAAERVEVEEILYQLHDTIIVLHELFINGCKPQLGNSTRAYIERVEKSALNILTDSGFSANSIDD